MEVVLWNSVVNSPFGPRCVFQKKHPGNLHSGSAAKCIDHGRMLKLALLPSHRPLHISKVAATYDLGAVKARYLKSISSRMIGLYAILLVYVDFLTDAEQNEVIVISD